MRLKKVNPTTIKVPEIRVTSQLDPETRDQFEAAVKEWGIETPILCFEVDGELVLVDGKNRLDQVLAAGDSSVDVVIREGDMVQVLTRNIFLDHLRGKHPVSDMIRVIRSLTEDYHLDSEQIMEQTKLTRDYIERLQKIATASPAVLEALDQGVVGVGVAFELSRLPYPAQQEEVIAKTQIYRLKTGDVKELVDATLREMDLLAKAPPPAGPAEPRAPIVYHCEACKNQIEPRYLRPVMLCPDCFGEVWRAAQHKPAPEPEVGDNGEGA